MLVTIIFTIKATVKCPVSDRKFLTFLTDPLPIPLKAPILPRFPINRYITNHYTKSKTINLHKILNAYYNH